ncbi:hypothetical protein AAFH68_16610 [Flavobacterium sp. CGRL1]
METRLKKLQRLQRTVGLSPDAIRNYQKLYGPQIGKAFNVDEVIAAMDTIVDNKNNFTEVRNIVEFELANLTEFEEISSSIIRVVDQNEIIGLRPFNRLKKELNDVYETIIISFIAVDNYSHYAHRKDVLLEKMESHRPVLIAELEIQRNNKRRARQ